MNERLMRWNSVNLTLYVQIGPSNPLNYHHVPIVLVHYSDVMFLVSTCPLKYLEQENIQFINVSESMQAKVLEAILLYD